MIGKVKETLIQSPALRQINFSVHSFEANESTQTLKDYLMQIASFIDEIQAVRPVYCNLRLWNMDGEALQAKNTLNQQILDLIEEAFHLPYRLNEKLMERTMLKFVIACLLIWRINLNGQV